jgi:hypothetical protein
MHEMEHGVPQDLFETNLIFATCKLSHRKCSRANLVLFPGDANLSITGKD